MVVRTAMAAFALMAGRKPTKHFPLDSCQTRLEGVPKEVERHVRVFPGPAIFLAVDNPSLRRMKLQTALHKATTDSVQHLTSLLLSPAMDEDIVRISFESNAREVPQHPEIERIVQKEIGLATD